MAVRASTVGGLNTRLEGKQSTAQGTEGSEWEKRMARETLTRIELPLPDCPLRARYHPGTPQVCCSVV